LNPTEAIGDVIKDRIGNVLWHTIADLEQAISEELRPLCEDAETVRRLVSHPWLVEQANVTAAENSAITCSKWYNGGCLNHRGALLNRRATSIKPPADAKKAGTTNCFRLEFFAVETVQCGR
jgi:hypothetical protein